VLHRGPEDVGVPSDGGVEIVNRDGDVVNFGQ
jgi:hypothetical protein